MPRKRPAAVTLLAAIDLAAAVPGACLGALLALVFWRYRSELSWNAGSQSSVAGVALLTILQNALLFAAGLGLAFGRRWGRRSALVYGWSGLLQAAGSFVAGIGWIASQSDSSASSALLALTALLVAAGSTSLLPGAQVAVCYAPSVRDYFAGGGERRVKTNDTPPPHTSLRDPAATAPAEKQRDSDAT